MPAPPDPPSPALKSDLVHPRMLAAVALLALNDHVLKGSGLLPGWLTGKLSDVAGLFFFPVLLVVVAEAGLRRLGSSPPRSASAAASVALTGLVFATLKTSPALAALASRLAGPIVCDPSDLLAVPSLFLGYLHLTRHVPPRPSPRWAQALTVALAGGSSMATSRPNSHHGYALWGVAAAGSRAVGCASAEVWVSKSGKQGLGATVSFSAADPACTAQIADARLLLPDGREVRPLASLPVTVAAGALAPPPPPPPPGSMAPPPAEPERGAQVYLPFAFDNEALWNDGERHATLELRLLSQGREEPWSIPLLQTYEGYHVHTPYEAPPPPPRPAPRATATSFQPFAQPPPAEEAR